MTFTEAELKGLYGEIRKQMTEEEAESAVVKADRDAAVDKNGVLKWKSNGNCPPQDFCELLAAKGYAFDIEATREAREVQNEEFFERYRKSQREISPELQYEIEAAFGKDKKIVDVITGEVVYSPEIQG
jgi:hypothetical protein